MNKQQTNGLMQDLQARYVSTSFWRLDFDLNKVADWDIKWDILYVLHKAGDQDYEEYLPTYSSSADSDQNFKRPKEIWLDNTLINP